MGYRIRSLNNIVPDLDWYFFLVGDYRNQNVINNLFNQDFDVIADRIGRKSAIVKDFGRYELDQELIYWLTINDQIKLANFIESNESRTPGLLIIDCHPKNIRDDSKVAYISFDILESTYKSTNELIKDIVDLSNRNGTALLKKTSFGRHVVKSLIGHVGFTISDILSINF